MGAVVTWALFLALGAQEQTPTFRSATRLVELTVAALDKKGNAVTDLRLQDFTIQETGTPPLPAPQVIPAPGPGPATDGPYALQAILPGGVTAGGVFADLLRVCAYLGARL